MNEKPKQLKRYTRVSTILTIINENKLYFSNPYDNKWDDLNDVNVLEIYRKKINANKIFAICFSSEHETIHLWKSYAYDKEDDFGCCINFNVDYLLEKFNENKIILDKVEYLELDKLYSKTDIKTEHFPFIKRYPYRIENEYRALWIDYEKNEKHFISIEPLKCIESIRLSQNITPDVINKINSKWVSIGGQLVVSISGKRINFSHPTSVYKNEDWINYFEKTK